MGGEKPPTSFSSFQENGGFVQFPDEAPQPSFFDGWNLANHLGCIKPYK